MIMNILDANIYKRFVLSTIFLRWHNPELFINKLYDKPCAVFGHCLLHELIEVIPKTTLFIVVLKCRSYEDSNYCCIFQRGKEKKIRKRGRVHRGWGEILVRSDANFNYFKREGGRKPTIRISCTSKGNAALRCSALKYSRSRQQFSKMSQNWHLK